MGGETGRLPGRDDARDPDMYIQFLYFNFVVTPRNFIIAKLSIRKPGSSSVLIISDFIGTDEDPGLRIESFAIIKLRGVTTKLKCNIFHHANFQGTI